MKKRMEEKTFLTAQIGNSSFFWSILLRITETGRYLEGSLLLALYGSEAYRFKLNMSDNAIRSNMDSLEKDQLRITLILLSISTRNTNKILFIPLY